MAKLNSNSKKLVPAKKVSKEESFASKIRKGKNAILESPQTTVRDLLPELIINYMGLLNSEFQKKDKSNSEMLMTRLEKTLSAKNDFYEVFDFFLTTQIKSIKSDLYDFILSNLKILSNFYLDCLDLEEKSEDWNILIVDFLFSNSAYLEESDSMFIFSTIIEKLIFSKTYVISKGILQMIVNTFININQFLSALKSASAQLNEISDLPEEEKSALLSNTLNFILCLPISQDLKKERSGDEYILSVEVFQQLIVLFISNFYIYFDTQTTKILLKKLNSHLFFICKEPEIIAEYLLKLYKLETLEKDIKILTLSCLFVLVTKFSYIFEEYYLTLYDSLFIQGILESSYANRLLKILYVSLKQSSVAKSIVSSFIKKLARIALFSSSQTCLKLLVLIEHILHYHHKCLTLLYRNRKIKHNLLQGNLVTQEMLNLKSNSTPQILVEVGHAEKLPKKQLNDEVEELQVLEDDDAEVSNHDTLTELAKYDQFDDSEKNPFLSGATKSCLWELYTLNTHFNFKVRQQVNKLSKKFISQNLDESRVLNISQEDVLFELNDKSNFYINYEKLSKESVSELSKQTIGL